jgi:ribosomal protein S18 acetylase RimI-like enzyme
MLLEKWVSSIRKANREDARLVSEIAEATFRAAFAAMNTAEHMDLHCRTSYAEHIQAAEISNPGMVTLLSEVEGRIVGYAQVRWDRAPGCVSAKHPGEIQRLYVVKDMHGKGIAQELMHACIRELEQRGADAVWLGVWEHNPRAIAFYKKSGFVEVGNQVFPLGGDLQRDIVMARLAAA